MISDFDEVWLVEIESDHRLGERHCPVRLIATEARSRRQLELTRDQFPSTVPYRLDGRALFVGFECSRALGCHLALGWPMPCNILDLYAEFRCLTSGLDIKEHDLAGAISYFGLSGSEQSHSRKSRANILGKLYQAMEPKIDIERALLRGRYMAAVARMEWTGIPIDKEMYAQFQDKRMSIQNQLIARVDQEYHVYEGTTFSKRRWCAWLEQHNIRWPTDRVTGDLVLDQDTFKDMAKAYPQVRPIKELSATLSQLQGSWLPIGHDSRNRCSILPFASKTGRNQPKTSQFIFGPASWIRGFIRPEPGRALAYVDYEQQEFGIAAALSGDVAMKKAYQSGDFYLAFAQLAGAAPLDATRQSHPVERERFKLCAIGVQYGIGPAA
jgi:DNA polymerase I